MKIASKITDSIKDHTRRFFEISRALNGQVEFGSPQVGPINISCFPITSQTPSVANTEFVITHNLGRIPSTLMFTGDIAGHIYASRRSQWTTTQAFFKSDQANVPFTGFVL